MPVHEGARLMASIFGKIFDSKSNVVEDDVIDVDNILAGYNGGGYGGGGGATGAGAGNVTFSGAGSATYTLGTSSIAYANVYTTASNWTTTVDDLTINRAGKNPIRVAETLDLIMERLAILQPNFEQMEKYPALRAAYDNYKLIEALCKEDETKDES